MRKAFPWFLIAGAGADALIVASWPKLQFAKLNGGDFMSRLGPLLLFALLIEQMAEIFFTTK